MHAIAINTGFFLLENLIMHNNNTKLNKSKISYQSEQKTPTNLKSAADGFQLVFGDLDLTSCHIGRLFGIERIANATRYENVQLNATFAFFGFAFVALLKVGFVLVERIAGRRWRRRLRLG